MQATAASSPLSVAGSRLLLVLTLCCHGIRGVAMSASDPTRHTQPQLARNFAYAPPAEVEAKRTLMRRWDAVANRGGGQLGGLPPEAGACHTQPHTRWHGIDVNKDWNAKNGVLCNNSTLVLI